MVLIGSLSGTRAQIRDREREPIIVVGDSQTMPGFLGAPNSSLEVWAWHSPTWQIGTDCSESAMSSGVTVLHDDTVAPPSPTDVAVTAVGASIVVEWSIPAAGDLEGYRIRISEQPGGPYTVAHQGLIDAWRDTYTVKATTGTTYYLVMTALDHAGNESAQTTEVSVTVP